MKERTFYTINLDSKRIFVLLLIFLGFLAYFFFLGRSSVREKKNAEEVTKLEPTKHADLKTEPITEKSPDELKPPEDKKSKTGIDTIELKPKPKEEAKTTPAVVEIDESKKTTEEDKSEDAPLKNTVSKITKPKKLVKKKTAKEKELVVEEKNYFTIQLGSFSSLEQANKVKDTVIKKNKLGGKYIPFVQKNNDSFVVRIGRTNSKEELEKILQNLDPSSQSGAWILSNKKP
jgi:cell division septation protein DedD